MNQERIYQTTNINGCDSVITLDLTINYSQASSENIINVIAINGMEMITQNQVAILFQLKHLKDAIV